MATALAQTTPSAPPATVIPTAPATPPAMPPAASQAAPQLPGATGIPGNAGHAAQAGQGGMTDIIDIKGPVLPQYDLSWLYWLLGILAVVALIALCVWLWKKKRARKAPPALPPFMTARNALDSIQQAGYAPREFYFQLSYVFRAYIENGLGLRALEKTTEELAPCLDRLPLDKQMVQQAKTFFKRADPVKYAGMAAEEGAMQKDLEFVRDVVEATRPRPEEETQEAGKNTAQPPEMKKTKEQSGHDTEASSHA